VLGLRVERGYFKRGVELVAGVDEAGRGPWAGPVVAAAVVVGPECRPLSGVDDSKLLTHRRREELAAAIACLYPHAVGAASPREIDRINVRQATILAMRRALARLPVDADVVLVDGLPVPELGRAHDALVDGDAKSFAIACASILAKTVRDRLMRNLARRYPAYGWEHNCGYGTRDHRRALVDGGLTPHHRRSFIPVSQPSLFDAPGS
jgi:ribonuclease HII